MKKDKLSHYAEVLARHAEAHWVSPVFFAIFFLDSFVMVIPADSLLSATVALNPRPVKKWYAFSMLGALAGFALLIFLGHTIFHEYLMSSIQETGFYSEVGRYLEKHASEYGLMEVALGVFTIVPCMIAALAGVAVGLNPWALLAIVVSAKAFRLALTIWFVHTSRPFLQKLVRFYQKTNV
jgi:Predicted membrane protein